MTKIAYELTSGSWWRAAGIRALRTALAVLLPIITASVTILEVDWRIAASTVALAVVVSFLTSLVGLKELTNEGVPKILALAIRAIKTFAQTAVAYIGAAMLITEVDWNALLSLSFSATVVTLIQGLITGLPEEETLAQ